MPSQQALQTFATGYKGLVTLIGMATLLGSLLSSCGGEVDSVDTADNKIRELVEQQVRPTFNENQVRANIQLTPTNLLAMLPDLNEYPVSLNARDDLRTEAVEIFTSSEKAGQGRDGFYLEMAQRFNQQGKTISNGKQAKVAIRKIASGLGAQFMLARRYVPDAFSRVIRYGRDAEFQRRATGADCPGHPAPNTAGIVVKSPSWI
ncbi:MAG: hypothetical protein R3E95_05240 [Thiolinea sp.]